jgi:hypothetical protein
VSEYREFVRRRLADPETYNTLMPVFFSATRELSGTAQLVNPLWLEMGVTAKGHKTFYYRRKPCAEDALERVHPWWKPSTEILVCRDDYRPTILADKQGTSCEVRSRDPNDTSCGCGPQLMFCGTDEVAQELNLASLEELQLTLKYLIESDRPYADVLAMNETVRSGIGNLVYARIDFFRTGTFKAPDPDQPPTLRPRSEVNLGGILSTPIYLWSDDRRAMLVHIMRDVMCLNLRARGVDTHTMLETLNRRDEHDLRAQTLMVLRGRLTSHGLAAPSRVNPSLLAARSRRSPTSSTKVANRRRPSSTSSLDVSRMASICAR